MDNVRTYFETARNLREGLREVWEEYQKRYDSLQGFNGTKRYDDELRKAQDKRDEKIAMLQRTARGKFDKCLSSMRENIANTPMTAPSAEQMNILQALKMRESVSRDELRKAAEQLKGVDVALKVLDEIGSKSGHPRAVDDFMGATVKAERAVDELARSAKMIVTLNRPDGFNVRHRAHHYSKFGGEFDERHEGVKPRSPQVRLSLSTVDKDISDVREAMREFGGVKDYDGFRAIVNRNRSISEDAQRRAGEI